MYGVCVCTVRDVHMVIGLSHGECDMVGLLLSGRTLWGGKG